MYRSIFAVLLCNSCSSVYFITFALILIMTARCPLLRYPVILPPQLAPRTARCPTRRPVYSGTVSCSPASCCSCASSPATTSSTWCSRRAPSRCSPAGQYRITASPAPGRSADDRQRSVTHLCIPGTRALAGTPALLLSQYAYLINLYIMVHHA